MTAGHDLSRRRTLGLAALSALSVAACGPRGSDGPPRVGSGSVGPPATSASAAPLPTGGGPVAFTPGKVRLGAYVELKGLSLRAGLALRRRQLGRDFGIVHRFYSWTDAVPGTLPEVPGDSTLMVSWRGPHYADITSGRSDRLIAAAARQLARWRRPTLLRWGWDMNRDFYRWGGSSNAQDTAGYVASWQRLHRIVGEQGAHNVSWVWSPNWNSHPADDWNQLANYYPGDGYVDWVGVSGYATTEQPGDMFDAVYDRYAKRKPVIVAEVAVVDHGGRTKADWIIGLAAWVRSRPAVGGVVWFDTDTVPGSTANWRIDTDKRSLAAYRAMAADPAFGG